MDPSRRSENMRRITSKNTKPEIILRSLLHRRGYRFRIHRKDLPGNPDIVFPARRKAIFVHGCFWHQHPNCREGRIPGSRQEYWKPKLAKNVSRDAAALVKLTELGWHTTVVWECELSGDPQSTLQHVLEFLQSEHN